MKSALTVPADAKMISTMQKIKGMTWLAQEITRRRYEKFARLAFIGGACLVTPATFPALNTLLNNICAQLKIAPPEFYLKNSPTISATIIGEEKPLLMVSDAALARLSERELECLLANALTHIYCEHLPYLTMCDLVAAAADNMGLLKSATAVPRMLLQEWRYAAEMSGDRGALWITNDLTLVLEFLCKLALPENNRYGKLTPENLLQQGELYLKTFAATPTCPVFHTWSNLYLQLPRYALRAVEINKWATSAEYAALRSGNKLTATNANETPAYWGAFADHETAWESVEQDEATADFLFGGDSFAWLRTNAGKIAHTGFSALSNAAGAFFGTFKK